MKKLSEEYLLMIKTRFENGESIKSISISEGKSEVTISRYLIDMKVKIKNGERKKASKVIDNKYYLEQIKELYNSGHSQGEIGKRLDKSSKTIGYHLRKMNIQQRNSSNLCFDKFKEMYDNNNTFDDIAKYFNVSIHTILGFRSRMNKIHNNYFKDVLFSEKDYCISNITMQMILGTLMGDASLSICKKNRSKNAKLHIVHSIKQKDLFIEKINLIGDLVGSYKLHRPCPDKRTGLIYETYRGHSRSHKLFTEIYNMIYINGVKKITPKYLSLITHPIALAYWFMDDGTNRGTIATNSFSYDENYEIKKWLLSEFNIHTTIQENKNGCSIYIRSKSRKIFDNLIRPYVIESMKYKLKYTN